ncbi:MAG: nitroreductase family protein [Candidatus Promineifilaceae bacterium]
MVDSFVSLTYRGVLYHVAGGWRNGRALATLVRRFLFGRHERQRYTYDMLNLAQSHRSIRSFTTQNIDDALLNDLLLSGLRSSSSGNMQTWSVIITRDETNKRQLYEAHGQQQMILEAPVFLTFCADVFRMREWLRVNESKQSFDDLLGFLTGTVDAVIAAQTISLAAESVGLGICYLGTTWWAADRIIGMLALPPGVFPVTSLVVGYPAEAPGLRDRLPLELLVHQEKYTRLSDAQIRQSHAEREQKAWARYNAIESVRQKLADAGITRVTDYYTSEFKYPKELHLRVSKMLIETLQAQGLWL